eukprot:scaffold5239_cov34-Prasinocladus_malaysianus.AAC.1
MPSVGAASYSSICSSTKQYNLIMQLDSIISQIIHDDNYYVLKETVIENDTTRTVQAGNQQFYFYMVAFDIPSHYSATRFQK